MFAECRAFRAQHPPPRHTRPDRPKRPTDRALRFPRHPAKAHDAWQHDIAATCPGHHCRAA
eukprot:6187812-Pleurochrysis_carterae.AAC.1